MPGQSANIGGSSTSSQVSVLPFPAPTEPFDDMYDSQGDMEPFPLLPFAACEEIRKTYGQADKDAIEHRDEHRGLARYAIWFGGIAVGMAICGLAFHPLDKWFAVLEFVFVLLAVWFWRKGLKSEAKFKWLARRHQAECCRQLKFKLFIQPNVWTDAEWPKKNLEPIESFTGTEHALQHVIRQPLPHGPFDIDDTIFDREELRELVTYYVGKRLRPQKEYLADRARHNKVKDLFRLVPVWLFSASIVAAGLHGFFVMLEAMLKRLHVHLPVSESTEPGRLLHIVAEVLPLLLAFLAALLPAAAASVRTWRAAFEFSRNRSRFWAAHGALVKIERMLVESGFVSAEVNARSAESVQDARPGEPAADATRRNVAPIDTGKVDGAKVLKELWWCEHILAVEHIEWLRLMMEAEWYG